VNITTSHKVSSNVLGITGAPSPSELELDSSNFGRKTLNMVNAKDIPHQVAHTKTVVLSHSGDRTIITRSHHAQSGRCSQRGSRPHIFLPYIDPEEARRDFMVRLRRRLRLLCKRGRRGGIISTVIWDESPAGCRYIEFDNGRSKHMRTKRCRRFAC